MNNILRSSRRKKKSYVGSFNMHAGGFTAASLASSARGKPGTRTPYWTVDMHDYLLTNDY